MTKTTTISRQQNNLYTVTTVETTIEKDVPLILSTPIPGPPNPTSYLFHDEFTSLGLKTSSYGISWSSSNAGSGDKLPVVSRDCLYNGKPSLKFTFGGGIDTDDAWSEQRIVLPNMPEFWMQFYRYYPNGQESPSVGPKWFHRDAPGTDNNKFLLFWSGPYVGYNVITGIGAWRNSSGHDVLYPGYSSNQIKAFGQHGLPSAPPHDDSMLGRWVKVNAHFKCATAANNDGVIQLWEDDNLKIDCTNLPLYPLNGEGNYFSDGYLMGWFNSGFNETTHCYLADVIIHDKPI